MKKIISCLMCILLAVSVLPVFAAGPDYTIEQKLSLQMQSSGFRGTLTAASEGESTFGLTEAEWRAVRAFTDGSVLNVSSMASSDGRESIVTLKKGDQEEKSLRFLTDGENVYVLSELLGDGSTFFCMDRDLPVGLLSGRSENAWPSPVLLIARFFDQDEAWQARVNAAANRYITLFGAWTQQYTSITPLEDGAFDMTIRVPATEVASEAAVMIRELMADPELLSLLREKAGASEAAAYLNPLMTDAYTDALSKVQLQGDLVIGRVYNAQGVLTQERAELPFEGMNGLEHITVDFLYSEKETNCTLIIQKADLTTLTVEAVYGEEKNVTGSFRLEELPGQENAEGQMVSESAPQVTAFRFESVLKEEAETYDAANDLCEKKTEWILNLMPLQESTREVHETRVTFAGRVYSGSSRRSATHINASLDLEDLETQAALHLVFEGATAVPWESASIAEISEPVIRVDQMTDEERKALTDRVKTNLLLYLLSDVSVFPNP